MDGEGASYFVRSRLVDLVLVFCSALTQTDEWRYQHLFLALCVPFVVVAVFCFYNFCLFVCFFVAVVVVFGLFVCCCSVVVWLVVWLVVAF